jgi:hypothetical protein
MSTHYHGIRLPYTEIGLVKISQDNGAVTIRDSRRGEHAEFNWGFIGDGASCLAEFLLEDVTADHGLARQWSIAFGNSVVALWQDGWTITADEILQWIAAQS